MGKKLKDTMDLSGLDKPLVLIEKGKTKKLNYCDFSSSNDGELGSAEVESVVNERYEVYFEPTNNNLIIASCCVEEDNYLPKNVLESITSGCGDLEDFVELIEDLNTNRNMVAYFFDAYDVVEYHKCLNAVTEGSAYFQNYNILIGLFNKSTFVNAN